MLANVEPIRNGFRDLADYLVRGDDRPTSPDRVAWMFATNLPTDDPTTAAHIMEATAARTRRCEKPTYHMSINWHPDERPSPEVMQEIARRTLDMAGLAEHQAFAMGHGDKPHAHLHMMINRVHPETGKAWATSHDYARFDRIMKLLADEYGFQHVPAHAYNPDATDDLPKAPNSAATHAAKRGANTARPQWAKAHSRAYGAALSEDLDMASGWEDVEALLAEDGYTLEPKGKGHKSGLVVGNAKAYTKFSALKLAVSAKDLDARFGQSFVEYRAAKTLPTRHLFTVDNVDVACAIGTKDDLRNAINAATGQRKARIANTNIH